MSNQLSNQKLIIQKLVVQKLVVQKYGGASLADPSKVLAIAKKVADLKHKGHDIIVVVSAMGNTTDQLTSLAYQISPSPVRRELDMLLSTGERVASSLVAMALHQLGVPAISFTGSQAGILTDDSHTNAQLIDLKPIRVEQELKKGNVVVLAGFQGVSPVTKEITTLGRGGTDLTAVAMSIHFNAEKCEILKEVDGVFSADPRVIKGAHQISNMTFEQLQEVTFHGAKMLHHRAAELAARHKKTLWIGLAHGSGKGTWIKTQENSEAPMFEAKKILSINSHETVIKIGIPCQSQAEGYSFLSNFLKENQLPWPQVLDSTQTNNQCVLLVTAPSETLKALVNVGKSKGQISIEADALTSVSATCAGLIASELIAELTHKLELSAIKPRHILLSPMSISFIVDQKQREHVIKALHSAI